MSCQAKDGDSRIINVELSTRFVFQFLRRGTIEIRWCLFPKLSTVVSFGIAPIVKNVRVTQMLGPSHS